MLLRVSIKETIPNLQILTTLLQYFLRKNFYNIGFVEIIEVWTQATGGNLVASCSSNQINHLHQLLIFIFLYSFDYYKNISNF